MKSLLVFVTLAVFAAAQEKKSYTGYQVLRTEKLSLEHAAFLRNIMSTQIGLDFWKEPQPERHAEIMAEGERLRDLKESFAEHGIPYTVKIDDVQRMMDDNQAKHEANPPKSNIPKNPRYNLDWDNYYRHDDFNEFLDELADTYSDFVSVESIGSSLEGRDMRVIKIGNGGPDIPNVWVEAGIHAREWISPSVATFIIRELVENNDAHPQYTEGIQIHVLPCTNPDGYEYTQIERMWRKTRSDNGDVCLGVDSNRNYDWNWSGEGASGNPCAENYYGPSVFSEIENRNVRDYVEAMSPRPTFANAIHSAAEEFLYPYGSAVGFFPDNVDEIITLGEACVDALNARHGEDFICMHSAQLYPASGDSNDWYTGVIGARFAYTTELRDNGFGFLLPTDQIVPSGEEMWEAYVVALDKVLEVGIEPPPKKQ